MTSTDDIKPAQVIRRTDTFVILRCPYCQRSHKHGVLRHEVVATRISHCLPADLAKAGRTVGGIYLAMNSDGSHA